ncbi:hypothetical protein J5X98_12625 [Leptothermofonsia sichuanensis E412]|uniref:hypothetical protein n=1 Tax=Leptothermofonsia sichuanensis TaxID=2917832 RepID=UPI001CA7B036|nr:hypothetical protein [Leptothermofonsia sichuanensis]QZZ23098.1 hypothetical protein J5X98_12625 [Leptothermofonsia sichuanensis E412]
MAKLNLYTGSKTDHSVPMYNRLNPVLKSFVLATAGIVFAAGVAGSGLLLETFQPISRAQALPARASSWGEMWGVFSRRKVRGGSRGEICPLAPVNWITPTANQEPVEIWSDRPLFLWAGTVGRIQVTSQTDGDMWDRVIGDNRQSIVYAGQPLQPDQTYSWKIFSEASPNARPKYSFRFRIVEPPVRDHITTELAALETQLKSKGATPEEIALQRANYFVSFANKDLTADALREMYSVKNPSPELRATIEKVAPELCNYEKACLGSRILGLNIGFWG